MDTIRTFFFQIRAKQQSPQVLEPPPPYNYLGESNVFPTYGHIKVTTRKMSILSFMTPPKVMFLPRSYLRTKKMKFKKYPGLFYNSYDFHMI